MIMKTINLNLPPPSALRDPRAEIGADASNRTSPGRAGVSPRPPVADPEYEMNRPASPFAVGCAWLVFHAVAAWAWCDGKISWLVFRAVHHTDCAWCQRRQRTAPLHFLNPRAITHTMCPHCLETLANCGVDQTVALKNFAVATFRKS